MFTTKEILIELKKIGTEQTKKTLINHGAPANQIFGVKVGDLKIIQKKIKKNHQLSLELFDTGISDAMYLAGLIADEKQITKQDLNKWVEKSSWTMISEYTVPWVAAESNYGLELGLNWIESNQESIISSGWSTLSSYLSITSNELIDIKLFEKLLKRIQNTIHQQPNRVRYTMNIFVISCGCYVNDLTKVAYQTAIKIDAIAVEIGSTNCKVPLAFDYIKKVEDMGRIGVKKKKARC